ncbi:MAG: hypothetical protein BA867_14185 [Desulfobacterales bacterium S5133MH16]|nr:MAG: hypothetical protein BA867_14185 [Desulfobacterales bacterium S5133MH16]
MPIFILPKTGLTRPALRGCITLLMILFSMAVTCISPLAESGDGSIFSTALPSPEWQMEGQPYGFLPPNLYEYINGEAEFFIAFGFIELTGANYTSVAGGKDTVTIDIYDMGNKLNAFGVLQSKRGGQASALNLGAASTGSDGYLAFYKDRFFVEIQAYITLEKEKGRVETMAASIAAHLPGDNTPPPELFYLPEKNRVAGSERYIKGGILGHAFLDRAMVCDYRIQGQKVTAFVAMLPSPRDAVQAVKQHRSFFLKSGKKCLSLDRFGKHGFVSEEPYHQKIIETQVGAFVAGVYDLSTIEAGKTLLADIIKTIKQRENIR